MSFSTSLLMTTANLLMGVARPLGFDAPFHFDLPVGFQKCRSPAYTITPCMSLVDRHTYFMSKAHMMPLLHYSQGSTSRAPCREALLPT
jgi:hypothetical protein